MERDPTSVDDGTCSVNWNDFHASGQAHIGCSDTISADSERDTPSSFYWLWRTPVCRHWMHLAIQYRVIARMYMCDSACRVTFMRNASALCWPPSVRSRFVSRSSTITKSYISRAVRLRIIKSNTDIHREAIINMLYDVYVGCLCKQYAEPPFAVMVCSNLSRTFA